MAWWQPPTWDSDGNGGHHGLRASRGRIPNIIHRHSKDTERDKRRGGVEQSEMRSIAIEKEAWPWCREEDGQSAKARQATLKARWRRRTRDSTRVEFYGSRSTVSNEQRRQERLVRGASRSQFAAKTKIAERLHSQGKTRCGASSLIQFVSQNARTLRSQTGNTDDGEDAARRCGNSRVSSLALFALVAS